MRYKARTFKFEMPEFEPVKPFKLDMPKPTIHDSAAIDNLTTTLNLALTAHDLVSALSLVDDAEPSGATDVLRNIVTVDTGFLSGALGVACLGLQVMAESEHVKAEGLTGREANATVANRVIMRSGLAGLCCSRGSHRGPSWCACRGSSRRVGRCSH